jgi:hypothetical protein
MLLPGVVQRNLPSAGDESETPVNRVLFVEPEPCYVLGDKATSNHWKFVYVHSWLFQEANLSQQIDGCTTVVKDDDDDDELLDTKKQRFISFLRKRQQHKKMVNRLLTQRGRTARLNLNVQQFRKVCQWSGMEVAVDSVFESIDRDAVRICIPNENDSDTCCLPVYRMEGDADFSYHGPGQLLIYPIFAYHYLRDRDSPFGEQLERVLLDTIQAALSSSSSGDANVHTRIQQDPSDTGIYVNNRKIAHVCAVRGSHMFSSYRIYINVHPDLSKLNVLSNFQKNEPERTNRDEDDDENDDDDDDDDEYSIAARKVDGEEASDNFVTFYTSIAQELPNGQPIPTLPEIGRLFLDQLQRHLELTGYEYEEQAIV